MTIEYERETTAASLRCLDDAAPTPTAEDTPPGAGGTAEAAACGADVGDAAAAAAAPSAAAEGAEGAAAAIGPHGHVAQLGRALRRGDEVTYYDREENAFPARIGGVGGAETFDEQLRPSYVVIVRRTTDEKRLRLIPAT